MKINFKALLPHLVAVVSFVIVSSLYFLPAFQGNELIQGDIQQYRGMSREIEDFRMMNGEESLWTNGIFGGMPSYAISTLYPNNYLSVVNQILMLGLPKPVGLMFLAMLGFYIFALCLRVNPWLGILGSLAFGLSTIHILYIGAGHVTKVLAITYMAPTLGGMLLAFRGKWLLGSILFALFFGLNIMAGHPQMTYYLAFLLFAVAAVEGIRLLIKKDFIYLGKVVGGLLLGVFLGILPNVGYLMVMSEYKPYSTRGNTELTKPAEGQELQQKGLSEKYILEYNYGPGEILSIVAPNAKGGAQKLLLENDVAKKFLSKSKEYKEYKSILLNTDPSQGNLFYTYWGEQKMSGGAFYFGVVMFVFFLFGLILLKDPIKWAFLAIFLLAAALASKDPGGLNAFFIHKFPMYNAFRDSKMILVLIQIMIPALGILFLDKLFKKDGLYTFDKRKFLYISGGILLVGLILYFSPSISGSFLSQNEITGFQQYVDQLKQMPNSNQSQIQGGIENIESIQDALIATRIEIYKSEILRMLGLIFLGCGIVFAYLYAKASAMTTAILTAIAIASVTGDNISVARRYLNSDKKGSTFKSYQSADKASTPYPVRPADSFILGKEKTSIAQFDEKVDTYLNKMGESAVYSTIKNSDTKKELAFFGVLNLNADYRVMSFQNPFNETYTSYFHKSIGGYQGAKMRRFQELIDFYIGKELGEAQNTLIQASVNASPQVVMQANSIEDPNQRNQFVQGYFNSCDLDTITANLNTPVLNMLNAKYFMHNPDKKPFVNSSANGNAWFVSTVNKVNNADQEMASLAKLDTKNALVVDQKAFSKISGSLKTTYDKDSSANVRLLDYKSNHLKYESNSTVAAPVVFSEIYYPEGWNCYIDGKQTEYFRANYILRSVVVPAGKHAIEWRFEPETYAKGSTYALIGSISLLLALFGILGMNLKNYLNGDKKSDIMKAEKDLI
jgi:hypothetical protein